MVDVSALSYRLAVLTHGDNGAMVKRALAAFREHVTPEPEDVTVHSDRDPQLGFCGATAALWAEMVATGNEYVFWLEHDFEICRPVDLTELVYELAPERLPRLAQMALMRDAYSREEKAAGGLFEYRRADFMPQHFSDWADPKPRWWLTPWFTTNPSLMRRDFMEAHPFPDDGQPFCEGRFGIALAEEGYSFGTWGDGSVYVKHIGQRTGFGY